MLGLASLRLRRYELSVCLLLASLLTSTYLIFQNGFLKAADLITFSAIIFDLQWKDIKLTSCNELLLKYRQSFQTSDILELSETPGHAWMWRRVWLISELYLLFLIEDIVWSFFWFVSQKMRTSMYRLKVEQWVYGSGLGLVVFIVHLSPVFRPPFCDQDGTGCRCVVQSG